VKKAKSYEIPYDELELQEEIGRGAYGIVYRGMWRDSDVAVKQLVFSHNLPPDLAEKEMETFLAEAAILKNLRPHANVLLFYGITPIPNLCIVTEFLSGGSLWSLLCSDQVIEWATVIKILRGIAAGMRHLHTEGIVHRDLAARNILLTASNDPKVADFGLSRTYVESGDPQHTKSDVGPVKWMAPESIRDREYSTKSDVWSFAVVVYEVLTRSEPFAGLDPIQVATRVVYENMRVQTPENAPPYLSELMDSCLQQNAKSRPEFREIVRKLDR
jgi:serine/threonine protein kinase